VVIRVERFRGCFFELPVPEESVDFPDFCDGEERSLLQNESGKLGCDGVGDIAGFAVRAGYFGEIAEDGAKGVVAN
jgi:hypothetical protein